MKKLILALFLLSTLGLSAQNFNKKNFSSPGKFVLEQTDKQSMATPGQLKTKLPTRPPSAFKSADAVQTIAIGQSANAWGFSYMRTTYLWANNDINSISFVHRMADPPGSGYLAYDLSTDGGQTWSVNNQVYDPNLPDSYNARYPQGLLYNPAGNTNPDEAYFSYFAPTLDASNPAGTGGSWGGYAWGSEKLGEGALPTQNNLPSQDDYFQYLPSGYTITQLGEAWVVDEENDGISGEYTFTGNLIVGHGLWNDVVEDFDYTFEHMPLEINEDAGINDVKVAFAPDGMTGWICALTNGEDFLESTWYHPFLFKTTDGGETWSDEPIEVQLGGEDGLQEVVNFISDEALVDFFDPEPVPDREDIPYFMGYHMDMAVDAWGNPHIMGVVAICDLEVLEWWNYEGVFALFHIYSTDQGETWESFVIDYPKTMDYEFTGSSGSTMKMYNRAQVSTTEDGAIVFFSFLDTRIEGAIDNNQPDIFFREYIPEMTMHGEEVINVTEWSEAMWQSFWGCMSHYVFADVSDNGTYECTIPFAYEQLEGGDIAAPVQFWYIPDFERSYTVTAIDEVNKEPLVSLAENFPNPFSETTHFNINLLRKSDVKIDVYNVSGQLIEQFNFDQLSNGPHQLTLNFGNIKHGIYFYTLTAGNSKFNGKMIVQ